MRGTQWMQAALAALMLCAAAHAAQAQDLATDRPVIVVEGVGRVEEAPDRFSVKILVRGGGVDQTAALQAAADLQSRVTERVSALEGLETLTLTTNSMNIEPVHDAACADQYDRHLCAIHSYVASIELEARGAPATSAGDVVSMAAESGAQEAAFREFSVSDTDALKRRADRAAFEDAQRQAAAIAEASGQRVVRVLRVQEPGSRLRVGETPPLDLMVTGTPLRATVQLPTNPKPIATESRLSVVFEVE